MTTQARKLTISISRAMAETAVKMPPATTRKSQITVFIKPQIIMAMNAVKREPLDGLNWRIKLSALKKKFSASTDPRAGNDGLVPRGGEAGCG